MTDTLSRLDEPGDAELISAVRGGDVSAYGGLFERHVAAARRLARQLVGPADADDLVSDAFAKVLRVLQGGGGPDVAFRAYLLTSVRRLHVDRIRANSKLHTTDDMEPFDPGVPFRDTAVEGFESAAAAKAFATLPERWQAVLWHTEVEGQKPAEVAVLLGMSPNSVSALAYRAREGLRQAFLNSHISELDDDQCAWTHDHLGAYIRNGISKRDASKVERHIDECRKCMAIYLELTEINSNLAGILAPLLLGSAGIPYLTASSLAAKGGILLFIDRGKDWVSANTQTAAVAGVAGLAIVAGGTFALTAGGDDPAPQPPAAAAPGGGGSGGGAGDGGGGAGGGGAGGGGAGGGGAAPAAAPPAAPLAAPPGAPPVDDAPSADSPAPSVDDAPPGAPPSDEPASQVPDVDLGLEVTATQAGRSAVGGMSAPRGPLAGSYTVEVEVTGLVNGVSARVTPSRTHGVVYTNCASGCVVTRDDPVVTITATNSTDTAKDITISAVPVGGRETAGGDNTETVTLQPAVAPSEPQPPDPTYDLAVTATATPPKKHPGQGNNKQPQEWTITVVVTGLEPGHTAVLKPHVNGALVALSGDCDVLTPCKVTSDPATFTFSADPLAPGTWPVRFTVASATASDESAANNTATVQVTEEAPTPPGNGQGSGRLVPLPESTAEEVLGGR